MSQAKETVMNHSNQLTDGAKKEAKRTWRQTFRHGPRPEALDSPTLMAGLERRLLDAIFSHAPTTVGLYIPIHNEPVLSPAFYETLRTAGVALALPGIHERGGAMRFFYYPEGAKLEPDAYKILAPLSEPECAPDLLVVPCVGFTPSGYRLGYGGGFFDRYLDANKARGVKTIGLCLEAFKVPETLFEAHDWTLDGVVTERQTY